jgi:hypothetical protein
MCALLPVLAYVCISIQLAKPKILDVRNGMILILNHSLFWCNGDINQTRIHNLEEKDQNSNQVTNLLPDI